MKIMEKQKKFEISGHTPGYRFMMVFGTISFCFMIFLAYLLAETLIEKIIITIPFTIFLILSLYATYYTFKEKRFQIDKLGIRFIFNNKMKKQVKWDEIKKVRGDHSGRFYFIDIFTDGKKMTLNTGWLELSQNDVVRAFREILKYQPKYKFIVKDDAGWRR